MFKVELAWWRAASDETLKVDVLSLLNFIHLDIPAKTETHSRLIWNMIVAIQDKILLLSLQLGLPSS